MGTFYFGPVDYYGYEYFFRGSDEDPLSRAILVVLRQHLSEVAEVPSWDQTRALYTNGGYNTPNLFLAVAREMAPHLISHIAQACSEAWSEQVADVWASERARYLVSHALAYGKDDRSDELGRRALQQAEARGFPRDLDAAAQYWPLPDAVTQALVVA